MICTVQTDKYKSPYFEAMMGTLELGAFEDLRLLSELWGERRPATHHTTRKIIRNFKPISGGALAYGWRKALSDFVSIEGSYIRKKRKETDALNEVALPSRLQNARGCNSQRRKELETTVIKASKADDGVNMQVL